MARYIIGLDFEWTCDEGPNSEVGACDGEIIEFSCVVQDSETQKEVSSMQRYVRPVRTPVTDFCKKLTGISDQDMETAVGLAAAVREFEDMVDGICSLQEEFIVVVHGSSDLEGILPHNCNALGIQVPRLLRKYCDLRQAVQDHLVQSGIGRKKGRASTLKDICSALDVAWQGNAHCGVDDSRMVVRASAALQAGGAELTQIDLDAEGEELSSSRLVLDGIGFWCSATPIIEWLKKHGNLTVREEQLSVVLGLDGMPSGRAVIDFGSEQKCTSAKVALAGAGPLTSGSLLQWPNKPPVERHIVVRPSRGSEDRLLPVLQWTPGTQGPALVSFPAVSDMKRLSTAASEAPPARNCRGTVKTIKDKFGFVSTDSGFDVFATGRMLERFHEGDRVQFDVARNPRKPDCSMVENLRRC